MTLHTRSDAFAVIVHQRVRHDRQKRHHRADHESNRQQHRGGLQWWRLALVAGICLLLYQPIQAQSLQADAVAKAKATTALVLALLKKTDEYKAYEAALLAERAAEAAAKAAAAEKAEPAK